MFSKTICSNYFIEFVENRPRKIKSGNCESQKKAKKKREDTIDSTVAIVCTFLYLRKILRLESVNIRENVSNPASCVSN